MVAQNPGQALGPDYTAESPGSFKKLWMLKPQLDQLKQNLGEWGWALVIFKSS